MKSIAVIMPYFGILPAQFNMWLHSAMYNASVDFLIFTDNKLNSTGNIKVYNMTFEEFASIIQEAFDFPIVLNRPYKLCEYKPVYGYALQKYIKGYDYWGFGDMDLVYGDIRAFITDEILDKYKMFLGWGHFTLFKNDDETNRYFMEKVEGYQYFKDAFTTEVITFFDEYDHKGCSDKWRDNRKEDCWLEFPFDNASKPKQSYHFNSLTRGWSQVIFEHEGKKLYMVKVENGQLVRKESLYAHFQHRNFMKDRVTDYSHFLVLPSRIINYPKHCAKLMIRYYCRNRYYMTLYYRWYARIEYKIRMLFLQRG